MKNGIASSAKLSMPVAIRCATSSDPGSSPVAITPSVVEMPMANATGTFRASNTTKLTRRTAGAIVAAQSSAAPRGARRATRDCALYHVRKRPPIGSAR